MASQTTETMVQDILNHERYAIRFEDLCIDTFHELQQIEYVKTSRTHDLGRDARGLSASPSSTPPIICCGTGADPVKKASDDLSSILKSVQPKQLLFCFTDPTFSELMEKKIKADVFNRCKVIESVEVYGGAQLAQLIARVPASFERLYAAELGDLRSALAVPSSANEEVRLTGLRIALTTQLHDVAQQKRADLVRNLILTALSSGKELKPSSLAKAITDRLHLPRLVRESWLLSELNSLESEGLVAQAHGVYRVEDLGRQDLARRTEAGARSLMKGHSAIRSAIEALLGYDLADNEFRMVWNTLEHNIIGIFLAHGTELIGSIASISGGETTVKEHLDLREKIREVAASVVQLPGAGPRMQEIAQAIEDLFHERESAAFIWLCDVAEVFLHLCALGLEPKAQQELLTHIQEIELLLDSDVVLSLMSPGEPNHKAVSAIVRAWRELGGTLHVNAPVLEEVSHHAWIAEVDYENTTSLFDKMDAAGALHLITNVFVRGYWFETKATKQKFSRTRWQYYISGFRGKSDHDASKIIGLLSDFGISLLAESDSCREQAAQISGALFDERKSTIGSSPFSIQALQEKCNRDGRLAAQLFLRRAELAEANRTAIVLSTSRSLRSAVRQIIKAQIGGEDPVLYTTAIAWLLSQVPGVRMGANCLRAVMLDMDFPIKLDPIERKGLRLLHESEEYRVHFSRRSTLKTAVRTEIRKRAAQAGVPREEIESSFLKNGAENTELVRDILASAVDQIASSKSERRIGELEVENLKLREELSRRK